MTSLDLGAVVGRVVLDTSAFDRGIPVAQRKLVDLAGGADKAAASVETLDDALATSAASAEKSAAATGRASKANLDNSAAEKKAALAAAEHSRALDTVNRVTALVQTNSQRMQQAQLRLIAAQERYDALLESGAATTKQLASAQAGLIGAQRALTTAQEQTAGVQTTLTGAMARQADAAERVEAILGTLAGQDERVQAATLRLAAAQERLDEAQASGTATARQLASAQAGLISAQRALVTSQDAAAASAAKAAESNVIVGGSAVEAGSKFASAAKMAGEFGLVIGGIELAKKAVEFVSAGNELTSALNGVQAASRATDAQMASVRTQVIGLGKDMTVPAATAVDATDALLDLVKAGLPLQKAMDSTRPALLLAAASQTNMADTARVLGDTLDIFGLSGKDAAHVANLLGASSLSASHDLLGLFDSLKTGGPVMRILGINVDQATTAITMLAKMGINTTAAGNGLNSMFGMLAKNTPATQKALADMGVTAFDSQGKFVGFPKLIDQLNSAQSRLGAGSQRLTKDFVQAFGQRGLKVAGDLAQKTGAEFDELNQHLESGDLQKIADQMNRGITADLRAMRKEFTAAGIDIYDKFAPGVTKGIDGVVTALPKIGQLAIATLHPFVTAWHDAETVLGPVGHALGDVLHFLAPIAPVVGGIASSVGTMWLAFKGYQIVRTAVNAVGGLLYSLQAKAASAVGSMQTTWAGLARGSTVAAAEQRAASLEVQVAATEEAAVVARSAAEQAQAQLELAQVMGTASTNEIAALEAVSAAMADQAAEAEASATTMVAAYDGAAAELRAASEVTEVSLSSMLGPIGLVVGAVALFAGSMHHSSDASAKAAEATAQIKQEVEGLTSAIQQDSGAIGENTKAYVANQLQKQGVYDAARKLGLSLSDVTQAALGNESANNLLAASGQRLSTGYTNLLGSSNLYNGKLTAAQKAQKKSLDDQTAAYSKVKSAITGQNDAISSAVRGYQNVQSGLKTNTKDVAANATATQTAAQAQQQLTTQLSAVETAYADVNGASSEFLAALDTFTKSAGTAADRAALIGATLKAANGDALGYVAAMNAGATATHQLDSDMASAAKSVGKNGESVRALMRSIVDLKTGTIDYSNAAAAPLISDLQGMQTAAMNAAQAMFQHEVGTKGAKAAADDAYTAFYKLTNGALVGQAKQLGLTKGEAQKLADTYFGMPDSVKTLIEQEGANPVLDVLNKIGALLAHITGQTWTPVVDPNQATGALGSISKAHATVRAQIATRIPANVDPTPAQLALARIGASQNALRLRLANPIPVNVETSTAVSRLGQLIQMLTTIGHGVDSTVRIHTINTTTGTAGTVVARAAGGPIVGPGTSTSDSIPARLSNGEYVVNAAATSRNRALLDAINSGAPGFAAGGPVRKVKGGYQFGDTVYASERAADNAARHAADKATSAQTKAITTAAGALGSATAFGPNLAAVGTIRGNLQGFEASLGRAGVPKAFLDRLGYDNKQILKFAAARNAASGALARANAALKAAQDALKQDRASFTSATNGAFDVTSAGQDANGRVTAGSLLAGQTQALHKVQTWVTDMGRLSKLGLFPDDYLRSLASKGPDALPTVEAILGMSPSMLKTFANQEKQISSLSGQEGAVVSQRLDGGAVARAQTQVRQDTAAEKRDQAAMNAAQLQLGRDINKELAKLGGKFDDLRLVATVKGQDLRFVLGTVQNQNKNRGRG